MIISVFDHNNYSSSMNNSDIFMQRGKSVHNFGGDRIRENFWFFRDGDRWPININGVGTQTTQISIIHQLHRGHIRGGYRNWV